MTLYYGNTTTMRIIKILIHYYIFFRLESSENFVDLYKKSTSLEKIRFIGSYDLLIVKTILRILRQGFNKRVIHIVPLLNKSNVAPTLQNPKLDTITFGVNLNIDHAFNYLEMGPHPHDTKVKEFVEFWGELSHLRRYAISIFVSKLVSVAPTEALCMKCV